MTAPDLTEARDLAAMWKVRAEAAEAALDTAQAKPSAARPVGTTHTSRRGRG